jgi:hypothetical protein
MEPLRIRCATRRDVGNTTPMSSSSSSSLRTSASSRPHYVVPAQSGHSGFGQPVWRLLLERARARPATSAWLNAPTGCRMLASSMGQCLFRPLHQYKKGPAPAWLPPVLRWLSSARARLRARALIVTRLQLGSNRAFGDVAAHPPQPPVERQLLSPFRVQNLLLRSLGTATLGSELQAVAALWAALIQAHPSGFTRSDDACLVHSLTEAAVTSAGRAMNTGGLKYALQRIAFVLHGAELQDRDVDYVAAQAVGAQICLRRHARDAEPFVIAAIARFPVMETGAPVTLDGFALVCLGLVDFWVESGGPVERLAFLRGLRQALFNRRPVPPPRTSLSPRVPPVALSPCRRSGAAATSIETPGTLLACSEASPPRGKSTVAFCDSLDSPKARMTWRMRDTSGTRDAARCLAGLDRQSSNVQLSATYLQDMLRADLESVGSASHTCRQTTVARHAAELATRATRFATGSEMARYPCDTPIALSLIGDAFTPIGTERCAADQATNFSAIAEKGGRVERSPVASTRVVLNCFLTSAAVRELSVASGSTAQAQAELAAAERRHVRAGIPGSHSARITQVYVTPPTLASRMFFTAEELSRPTVPGRRWASSASIRHRGHTHSHQPSESG